MSAAATAAGYLYASGRLRGRNAREGESREPDPKAAKPLKRREVKVAVYEPAEAAAPPPAAHAKRAPKIQYRTRRWKPE